VPTKPDTSASKLSIVSGFFVSATHAVDLYQKSDNTCSYKSSDKAGGKFVDQQMTLKPLKGIIVLSLVVTT
jgi:predicted porin